MLGVLFSISTVSAVVGEENTGTEESTEVQSASVLGDDFPNESTEVGSEAQAVVDEDEDFGEESTEVLGDQDSVSGDEFGEESTEVGGPDNGNVNGDSDNESNNNNRSSRSGQRIRNSSPQGEVLGAFTGSCPFLTTYMRIGQSNDVAEVTKLQEFLNSELGIMLPATGFFGQLTHDAVNAFQLKYKDSVLLPWVEAGLMESKEVPTGYVYKTTLHTINKIVCPDMDVAKPVLN